MNDEDELECNEDECVSNRNKTNVDEKRRNSFDKDFVRFEFREKFDVLFRSNICKSPREKLRRYEKQLEDV